MNCVGGPEIAVDWGAVYNAVSHGGMANQPAHTAFSTTVRIRQTATRDAKWAFDVDPGMLPLPATVSAIHRDQGFWIGWPWSGFQPRPRVPCRPPAIQAESHEAA